MSRAKTMNREFKDMKHRIRSSLRSLPIQKFCDSTTNLSLAFVYSLFCWWVLHILVLTVYIGWVV